MQQPNSPPANAATDSTRATRHDTGGREPVEESLALEGPLEIRLNGRPFTVTMRTPGHDDLLARGLLHTEGVIAADTVAEIALRPGPDPHDVALADIVVPPATVLRDFAEERTLAATSSCGLCGRTRFRDDEMEEGCPLTLPPGEAIDPAMFPRMIAAMRAGQTTFDASGGVHAAALFAREGPMHCLFEDVGRHNAVDKAVGWLLAHPEAPAAVLAVSGRVSYEIVVKCWRARVGVLIAVSAPTSLAVRTARRLGITLAGFCRDTRATLYT